MRLVNSRSDVFKYIILIVSILTIYLVLIASFLTIWRSAHNLGIHIALLVCFLTSLLVLTFGARIFWGLVVKLSKVS